MRSFMAAKIHEDAKAIYNPYSVLFLRDDKDEKERRRYADQSETDGTKDYKFNHANRSHTGTVARARTGRQIPPQRLLSRTVAEAAIFGFRYRDLYSAGAIPALRAGEPRAQPLPAVGPTKHGTAYRSDRLSSCGQRSRLHWHKSCWNDRVHQRTTKTKGIQ
jgi:hypothetical protein